MSRMFFTAIFIGGLVFSSVSLGYSGGSGMAEEPYQIANKADLLALAGTTTDYNKCFVLTADINVEGQVFTSAIIAADTNSSSGFQGTSFTGTFDGNGHKITNFTINGGSNDYFGLFGYVDSNSSVKNLSLENCTVSGSSSSIVVEVGGLVGFNSGSITNCYLTGIVIGSFSSMSVEVGGLVGCNSGNITNCCLMGSVSGSEYVGGLAGYNSGSITNCYSAGAASGVTEGGGLVGYNCSNITNCYSMSNVDGFQYVGGLVGDNSRGSISNCYSTGAVGVGPDTGGLVGYNNSGTITNCFWDIQTSGRTTSAGGTGLNTTQMMQQASFTGWDFTTPVWTIKENKDYPHLWWEKEIVNRILFVPAVYPTIQSAINAAFNGDTVIIAPGTYTGFGNRDIDFLGKLITIRSADPNDPNIVAVTIIDCNGAAGVGAHRGFYFHRGEGANSIVEGFTIIRGYAIINEGGGICCSLSSPTIINCNINGNSAKHYGGGIYCEESSPTITGCTITGNSVVEHGGGIYCYLSSPTITNCTITANSANYHGGGICCEQSSPEITDCTITGNSARTGGQGGGIYCSNGSPEITDCTIAGNYARISGGIFCDDSSPTITNCIISSNNDCGICCIGNNATITACTITGSSASGIYCSSSNATITNCIISDNNDSGIFGCNGPITNCTITGNSASTGGGISVCEGPITNCTITGNSAKHNGGGLYGCGGPITNCIISGNFAYSGGGLYFCDGPITNCAIIGNSTAGSGGGIFHCHGPITNCTITGNSAGRYGGGLYDCGCPITNCTIAGNSAYQGGGLTAGLGQRPITNCIIWNNWPDQIVSSPVPIIIYNDVQGGWPGLGNIDVDSCFVQPGYWADANDPNIIVEPNDPNAFWIDGDYRLLFDSPCIDTGDPNYVPEPNETDLDGNPRTVDGDRDGSVVVDMGAYEYQNTPPVAVAGPNQVAYAFIDGYADVNLDASGSYDDDNDILDYYWSWTIDDSNYEANGVNPTIKLPVGKHTIELVVDDGIDLSQPDYCTITVIKAVRGKLTLSPRVIETKSCGKWILATLFIPPVPGEKVNTNEPFRLYPGGIEAKYQRFSKYGMSRWAPTLALAYFDKQQVINALGPGQFEVSIVGRFTSGRFFFGSDTIKIISPKPKPPHYWHW